MNKNNIIAFLQRLSIAIVFFYAAIASFVEPQNWIGYFPSFMTSLIPANILLPFFSVYEIILALWLLWGRWTRLSTLLSVFTLSGIIMFNLTNMDVLFRDLSILIIALSLVISPSEKSDRIQT